MKVITSYTTNASGRGTVVAVATINGKRRQKSTPWSHADSRDRNHGSAAGNLLLANALDTITGGLTRAQVNAATHTIREDGSHLFTL